jgi:hypothetical protein
MSSTCCECEPARYAPLYFHKFGLVLVQLFSAMLMPAILWVCSDRREIHSFTWLALFLNEVHTLLLGRLAFSLSCISVDPM